MGARVTKQTIRDWWAASPQTYGAVHGETTYETERGVTETLSFGKATFFDRLDKTFYAWTEGLHTEAGFFAKLFPYDMYQKRNVLEIGCGLGTMAMNWARHGAYITGIDLNPVSVAQSSLRFKLYDLPGRILQMDATCLAFDHASFDYVYSWGVLHHSPDLSQSMAELFRILKPGGGYGVMLYNRRSVFYRYMIRYLEGYLHGESHFLNPLELASRYTDGGDQEGNPYTWPVTPHEMQHIISRYSDDVSMCTMGSVEYGFPPKIGAYLPHVLKAAWARRFGWSLWITGTKR